MSVGHDRPNILVFFTDQQRWDTVGCYGQALPITPNLDRLADEGVRFEHAFTCQPVCGPARACMQTGKYATQVGCFRNGIALPVEEQTLASRLSGAGYDVGYCGKWHLASTHGLGDADVDYRTSPVPPQQRGGYEDFWMASDVLEFTSHSHDGHMFDAAGRRVEFPPGRYRADCVTDFAIEYLRRRSADRPFFLFVSYIEPHHQNDHNRTEGPHGSKRRWAEYDVPGDLRGTQGDWRENYPDYLGCVASLDANLGRFRQALAELGRDDDTLIVFTSDHGSHFRTRNAEYKRSCHDACIRIPMVIRGPGFRGGHVIDEMVSLLDVPPTIVSAGGLDPPADMRGRPLQGLVDHAADDWPDEVFLQISESHVGRAIRTRRWKYSVRAPDAHGAKDAGSSRYVEDFLYDLAADPHERDNLVADAAHAAVRAELVEVLQRRMVAAGEAEPTIAPAP